MLYTLNLCQMFPFLKLTMPSIHNYQIRMLQYKLVLLIQTTFLKTPDLIFNRLPNISTWKYKRELNTSKTILILFLKTCCSYVDSPFFSHAPHKSSSHYLVGSTLKMYPEMATSHNLHCNTLIQQLSSFC